jgi:hypothetical protein
MNMPGFTGEVSLGKTTGRYGLTLEHSQEGGKVHPQGLTVHCYEGGHCSWHWVPDPPSGTTGSTPPARTKY